VWCSGANVTQSALVEVPPAVSILISGSASVDFAARMARHWRSQGPDRARQAKSSSQRRIDGVPTPGSSTCAWALAPITSPSGSTINTP